MSSILVFIGAFIWYVYRLTDFPIFADEAIYLHWAKRIALGDESIFISMFDGKPPLFMWFSALGSLINPYIFLIGRLVSVLSLFLTVIIIWRYLQKSSLSWAWASLVFILAAPFIFFHGRLALLDMLLTSFLSLAVLAWSQPKLKFRGLITGILLGLAFLAKTPAIFLLPLPILSSLLFNKKALKQAVIAVITTLLIILSLKVSVWFPSLFARSQDFTFSIKQVLSGQISHLWPNLKISTSWLSIYLTWPVLFLAVLGSYSGFKLKNPFIQNLSLAVILFASPIIVLGKILSSRYLLPLGIFLPLLAGFSLRKIQFKRLTLILAAFLAIVLPFNNFIQFSPYQAYFPIRDEEQYLKAWSSGIGLKEVSDYLFQQSQDHTIKVLTEGYFGTLPDGLFVLKPDASNQGRIEIIGVGSPDSDNFNIQLESNQADKVFYLGNHDRIGDIERGKMQLIKSYPKKDQSPPLELYLVK